MGLENEYYSSGGEHISRHDDGTMEEMEEDRKILSQQSAVVG